MDKRQTLFLQGPIFRALVTLAVPIILGNILQTGYQLTDAFWVGRLGTAAVAAIALSFPVTFLVIAIGSGLSMAGATLSAQYMGAGRQDMVNHVAAQTMVAVAITSTVLSTIGYVLTPELLTLLGVAPDVYAGANAFMHVSFIGTIFVFIYMMFQALMRGIGQTRVPLYIVMGSVSLNFAIDPLLIFGCGPVPAFGVMGAALATLLTQALAACIGMVVFLRGRHGIHLAWRALKPDPVYIRRAIKLGLPASVEMSARALGMMMMSFLVVGFGTATTAAYGVGSTIVQVVMIPAMGISMAVSTLVGQNIGAGNIARAERATVLGTICGFVLLSFVGIVAFIFAPELVAFFVPSQPDIIARGSLFIRIMCLAWGGMGIQLNIVAAFRASGNMLIAMVIALVSQWMVQFPLAYLLSQHTALHAVGLWWSFPATNVIVAIVSICWFMTGSWKTMRVTDQNVLSAKVTEEVIYEEGFH
jgi:putative MATE family efflux protein